jgi:PAS domain S-box-containing protein
MFDNNNDFFKTLSILYIESNNEDSTALYAILEKNFKKVILIESGQEAIEYFTKEVSNIDIIICDMYLNDILGVDVLEKIRDISTDSPFILTTKNLDTDELLKAIKFNTTDFLTKPIETSDLLNAVDKICQNNYFDILEKNAQKDLEDIISVIDEVALVSKTNLEGKITYVNKAFCEASGYEQSELLGNTHDLIRDINRVVCDELSSTIRSGNIWEGKLKNISKSKEEFYVYITVIPLFDNNENIKEFIWIRFLATEYELEQKNFKKKVAQNINENRRINTQARDKINQLLNKLQTYKSLDYLIDQELHRKNKFESQISYFESQSKTGEDKLKDISSKAKEKINHVISSQKQSKKDKDEISIDLEKYITEYQLKNKTVKELMAELDSQKKMIEKLNLKIDSKELKLGLKD